MKVKICGLKSLEDIRIVNKYLPDYVGFVFAGKKRKITKEQAFTFRELLDPRIKTVAVFVNESFQTVKDYVASGVCQVVQLHGEEDTAYLQQVLELRVPVIQACGVRSKEDILKLQSSKADYLLFDSYSKDAYGGTGNPFDHDLLSYNQRKYFLAGGIREDNLRDILKKQLPYAIDVSSGVETDGYKDERKIKNLIELARSLTRGKVKGDL